jgi:hypothetical protein
MHHSEKELVHQATVAEVYRNKGSGQHFLSASKTFKIGEVVCSFNAKSVSDTPTYLTVQVSNDKHITLYPEFLQYINHSCVPNVFFDTERMELICIRDIHPGDEITFFYPSTEWEMAQPFLCQCGNPECLQIIQGAAFLPENLMNRHRVTRFIENKMSEKSNVEIS